MTPFLNGVAKAMTTAFAPKGPILEIGRRRNVTVVEDACQAHLAEWRGRKVGTCGKVDTRFLPVMA